MQDLTGKTPGGNLTAAEWNQLPEEVQNIITTAGISLSGGDLMQVVKGLATIVGSGTHYTDSGAANAYVLTAIGTLQPPTQLLNGMQIGFVPANNNTGASTVNVATLGALPLVSPTGAALVSGQVLSGQLTQAYYYQPSNHFRLMGGTTSAGAPLKIVKSNNQFIAAASEPDDQLSAALLANTDYRINGAIRYVEAINPSSGAFTCGPSFPSSLADITYSIAQNTTYISEIGATLGNSLSAPSTSLTSATVGRGTVNSIFTFECNINVQGAPGTFEINYAAGTGGSTTILPGSSITVTTMS